MQTRNLFYAALLATTTLFSSCGDENKNVPEPEPEKNPSAETTTTKRVTKITLDYQDDYSSENMICTFAYDKDGRVTLMREVEEYNGNKSQDDILTYSWNGNKVREIYSDEDGYCEYIFKNNGLLEQWIEGADDDDSDVMTFAYDTNGRLTKTMKNGKTRSVLTWKDGKLTKITENGEVDKEYLYDGTTCKGYMPFLFSQNVEDDMVLMWVYPDKLGVSCNYLPSMIIDGDNDIYNCSYKFDKEGYVISMTTIEEGSNATEKVTFTWN